MKNLKDTDAFADVVGGMFDGQRWLIGPFNYQIRSGYWYRYNGIFWEYTG